MKPNVNPKERLRDLAPEFRDKSSGWRARWFAGLIVLAIGGSLIAEAAPQERGMAALMKIPGSSWVVKKYNDFKAQ